MSPRGKIYDAQPMYTATCCAPRTVTALPSTQTFPTAGLRWGSHASVVHTTERIAKMMLCARNSDLRVMQSQEGIERSPRGVLCIEYLY